MAVHHDRRLVAVADDAGGVEHERDARIGQTKKGTLETKGRPDLATDVGEQPIGQMMMLGEALVRGDVVRRDTKNRGTGGGELRGRVAKRTGLSGAAGGLVFGIKEHDDGPLTESRFEGEDDAVLVGQRKQGGAVTDVHGAGVGMKSAVGKVGSVDVDEGSLHDALPGGTTMMQTPIWTLLLVGGLMLTSAGAHAETWTAEKSAGLVAGRAAVEAGDLQKADALYGALTFEDEGFVCERAAVRARAAAERAARDGLVALREAVSAAEPCPAGAGGFVRRVLFELVERDPEPRAVRLLLSDHLRWDTDGTLHARLVSALDDDGDPKAALELSERALERFADNAWLNRLHDELQRRRRVEGSFQADPSARFVVVFEGQERADLAQLVVSILDEQWLRLNQQTLLRPPRAIPVYLYTDQQYADVSSSPSWSGGHFDGARIRIRRADTLNRRQLEAILTHELVHAFVGLALRPDATLPGWFNEGLAETFAAHADTAQIAWLPLLCLEGVALPLQTLNAPFRTLDDRQSQVAYLQAHAMVRPLIEAKGAHTVFSLIKRLNAGDAFADAFRLTYFTTEAAHWAETCRLR